jgi:hypothetical protein
LSPFLHVDIGRRREAIVDAIAGARRRIGEAHRLGEFGEVLEPAIVERRLGLRRHGAGGADGADHDDRIGADRAAVACSASSFLMFASWRSSAAWSAACAVSLPRSCRDFANGLREAILHALGRLTRLLLQ